MEYKIISVESRKGGVGKTTAALNLANLLIDKEYDVLLLDVDITGTSITGSYNSSYWQGKINPIKYRDHEVNLLEIFHRSFLNGNGLPEFSLKENNENFHAAKGKINVFNSEIYNDDSTLLCDPRILFDELHSFWLIEMIETLCNSFAEIMGENKIAIILDNSPGYVGLGKAIHDWLTDIGPQSGKFLTMSSLDVQDLNSCLSAVLAINHLLETKVEGARYYMDLINHKSNITEPTAKEARNFFLKLANTNAEENKYEYFKKDDIVAPGLSSYQSLIINKAPREIESIFFDYEFSKIPNYTESKKEVIDTFLWDRSNNKRQNFIYFDENIQFQFMERYIT